MVNNLNQIENWSDRSVLLLEAALESTPDGILVVDINKKILIYNHKFIQMWHIPEAILVSPDREKVFDILVNQLISPQKFLDKINQCYSPSEQNYDLLECKDGRILESYSQAQQIGEKIVVIWNFRDITGHHKIEIVLKESEERFRQLAENLDEVLQIVEVLRMSEERFRIAAQSANNLIYEWDITNGNLQWFGNIDEQLEYEIGEFPRTRKAWETIIHPEDYERVMSAIERHLQTRSLFSEEYRIKQKDGTDIYWHDRGTALWNENGNPDKWIGSIRNITNYKQTELALQAAENKYRRIFENFVDGIFQTTVDGHYLIANPRLAQIYGYNSPEELIAVLTDIEHQLYVTPDRRTEFINLIKQNGAVWEFESQVYRKDGSTIWIAENAYAIRDSNGQTLGYEGTVKDISDRKQAEEALSHSLATNQAFLNVIPDAMFRIHKDGTIIDYKGAKDSAFGINTDKLVGRKIGEFLTKQVSRLVSEKIKEALLTNELQSLEYQLPVKDGNKRAYEARIVVIGEDEILAIVRDISVQQEALRQRKQAEETILYHANYDIVTGLPNRKLCNEQLPLLLEDKSRSQGILAVMFLDLDRFKTINDTLGHTVGDRLLQEVAERLTDCLGDNDTIVRWGGDEFIILLSEINSADDAAKVAQIILDSFKPALNFQSNLETLPTTSLHISSSIGIALYPNDGKDADTLLKNADIALYRAKEQGRNNYQFYKANMNSRSSELLCLENELHQAIKEQQFVVYYQPQVNIRNGQIIGMEALVRWHHPEYGLVSPGKFIPLAEETGLIVPIGKWVLHTACVQNKAWQDAGLPPIRMAVNLSALQFKQPNIVETVAQVLSETGLMSEYLELEITESVAMNHVHFTTTILNNLHQMGVQLSLDDFGTGYSSLSYLKKFPIHKLKIDRSFVRDLTKDPNDVAIVAAIIALAKSLNLEVIAEGVETEEQKDLLRSLRCKEMQGYFFSYPLKVEDATQFLRNSDSIKIKAASNVGLSSINFGFQS